MQWWAWVIIWAVLVLALIGMLVFFAFRLFRQARAALRELEKLTEQLAQMSDNVTELQLVSPPNAMLEGYATVARRRDALLKHREDRKQVRRDKTIERGKLLIRTDFTQRTWPHAR